jgi:hypothetical protein
MVCILRLRYPVMALAFKQHIPCIRGVCQSPALPDNFSGQKQGQDRFTRGETGSIIETVFIWKRLSGNLQETIYRLLLQGGVETRGKND